MTVEPREVWRPIPGWSLYDVSDSGRVRSWCNKNGGRLLVPYPKRPSLLGKYRAVGLYRLSEVRTALVHRLVLEAFVGLCPDGMECRHLNGICGDNRLVNLVWGTPEENADDKRRHGRAVGERNPNAKLNSAKVLEIRALSAAGVPQRAIAKRFQISNGYVCKIVSRENWAGCP